MDEHRDLGGYDRLVVLALEQPIDDAEIATKCGDCGTGPVFKHADEQRRPLCAGCYSKLQEALRIAADRGFRLGL